MPRTGFETMIPVLERSRTTGDWNHAATGTGFQKSETVKKEVPSRRFRNYSSARYVLGAEDEIKDRDNHWWHVLHSGCQEDW